jgi:hypothetical protein
MLPIAEMQAHWVSATLLGTIADITAMTPTITDISIGGQLKQ